MEKIIAAAEQYVREFFEGEASGHDVHHTFRVCALARRIAASEGADVGKAALAALLHDVDDRKISPNTCAHKDNARAFMQAQGVDAQTQADVLAIISTMSFGGDGRSVPDSLEGKCVQDADRLDAMGAIGIARTFAFGGSRGRQMHDPAEAPDMHLTPEAYAERKSTSINHFHEKLLRLRDLMNTREGRRLAEGRHAYMEAFLEQFHAEWRGER
ncbi:MAG: HD domain-containing protein [Clostridia bacterium]|nr:HD domain-containing protein [Clostridia bacterium]